MSHESIARLRCNLKQHDPHVFWLTGLPASGKTTLAQQLELALIRQGVHCIRLDGDELRRGLCSDLGLSEAERRENIRRAGEVARLLFDAGLVVICAFISPYTSDRQRVRELFPSGGFTEIYLSTSLDECIRRDPKGLYARARAGELQGLTGWDAPYEVPGQPEFVFDTQSRSPNEMLAPLLARVNA